MSRRRSSLDDVATVNFKFKGRFVDGDSSQGQSGAAQTLVSVSLSPDSPTVQASATQQMVAVGHYSDGSTADVSASATWSTSNASIATVIASGLVSGVAIGSATISASVAGITGSTAVAVSAFALDLTLSSLPSSLSAGTRAGGDVWVATSDNTAAKVIGNGVYEKRSTLGGWWSFPAYSNEIPAPFNHADATWITGGTQVLTAEGAAGAPTGPDGVPLSACALKDTDSGAYAVRTRTFAAVAPVYASSGWVRASQSDPPTSPGGMYLGGGGSYGVPTPTGTAWSRWNGYAAGNAYHGYIPAGFVPPLGPHSSPSFDVAALGSMEIWGSQMIGAVVDYPLANTSAGAQDYAFDSSARSRFSGDLDVQGRFMTALVQLGAQQQPDGYLWSMTGPDGLFAVRMEAGAFIATARGADILNGNTLNFGYGKHVTWRFIYAPSTGQALLRVTYSGVYQDTTDIGGATSGSALSTPTDARLGSNLGSSHAAVQHLEVSFPRLSALTISPEFAVVGDSICGPLSDYAITSSYVYTYSESKSRPGIVSLAVAGNTVNQQLTAWNASAYSGSAGSGLRCAVVMVGVNDIAAGDSAVTIVGRLQTLTNKIKSDHPAIKIALCAITPCKRQLDALNPAFYPVWQALNTAILGGSVTGCDLLSDGPRAALEDGTTGNLKEQYDKGDGIHPNNLGRQAIGEAWRSNLQTLGLL